MEYYNSVKTIDTQFKLPQSSYNNSCKVIQFSNGLTALLISDTNSEATAVSVSVNSGSNQDNGIQGLAHLVEHSIFSGTKEFPQPYHLIENVFKVGGSVNAFTTYNQTNFHFEVPVTDDSIRDFNPGIAYDEPVLNYTLRVFASLFKNPLFNADSIKLEIAEINEEHMANLNSTDKKFYHGLKLLANHLTQFCKFSTGNKETLNIPSKILKKHLKDYFDSHYFGGNMKLVIKSSLSLFSLQKLVMTNFDNLIKKSRDYLCPLSIFTIEQPSRFNESGRILFIETKDDHPTGETNIEGMEENHSKLRVIFPLSNLEDNSIALSKLWIELLGQESEGSLCDCLLDHGYCSEITVFDQFIDTNNMTLIIEMTLTATGRGNILKILSIIFNYIDKIINLSEEYLQNLIEDFIKIEKLNFIHKDSNEDCLKEVSSLSELMHYLHYDDLFLGYRLQSLSPKLVKLNTKKWLNINNVSIIVMSDSNIPEIGFFATTHYDEYYQFTYRLHPLNKQKVLEGSLNEIEGLTVPKVNKFLKLVTHLDELLEGSMNSAAETSITKSLLNIKFKTEILPQLIENNDKFELWYKKEFNYNSKVYVSFHINLIQMKLSVENYIVLDIICETLSYYLKVNLYPLENLGFTWSIFPTLNSTNSITFNFNGLKFNFNYFLALFIKVVYYYFVNFDKIPYSIFMKSRVKVRKSYVQILKTDLFQQSLAFLVHILEEKVYSLPSRLTALEELSFLKAAKISKKIPSSGNYISILINGDLELNECYQLSRTINKLAKHLDIISPTLTPSFVGSDKKHSKIDYNSQINSKVYSSPKSVYSNSSSRSPSLFKSPTFVAQSPSTTRTETSSMYSDDSNQTPVIIEPSSYNPIIGKFKFTVTKENKQSDENSHCLFYIHLGDRNNSYTRAISKLIEFFIDSHLMELKNLRRLGYRIMEGLRILRQTIGYYIYIESSEVKSVDIQNNIEDFLDSLMTQLESLTEDHFKKTILQPCLASLELNNESKMSPNIIFDQLPACCSTNFGSISKNYFEHKSYWEKILNRSYRFKGRNGYEQIDTQLLNKITKLELIGFFKKHLNPNSLTRSILVISSDNPQKNIKETPGTKVNGGTKLKRILKNKKPIVLVQLSQQEQSTTIEEYQYRATLVNNRFNHITNLQEYL